MARKARLERNEQGFAGKMEKMRKFVPCAPGSTCFLLREDQGPTATMNFGTGRVGRSDFPFSGWVFAVFGVSHTKTGEKPQFWRLGKTPDGKEANFCRSG